MSSTERLTRLSLLFALARAAIACGGDDAADGSSEGQGASGSGGASLSCGDQKVDPGEDCDDGDTDDTDGCTQSCQFGCASDGDCSDGAPCNGSEVCEEVADGRRCNSGTPAADGSACEDGTCLAGQCKPLSCGNGALDDAEQCDDGDDQALDGCDAACRYELVLRLTGMEVVRGTAPAWCATPENRFGNTFSVEALQVINEDLNKQIAEATLNLMLDVLELDELSGGDDAALKLGVVAGTLDPRSPTPWSAGAVDAWFLADSTTVDADGKPTSLLSPASLAGGQLQGGESDIVIPLLLGAQAAPLAMLRAQLRASVDAATPDVPAPPPEALASGLTVLRSIDGTGADRGMCGDATIDSLAKIPLPEVFSSGGAAACDPACGSETYTYCGQGMPVGASCNSLLDAMVGGCIVSYPDCIDVFLPSQPDVGTGGNPPAPLTSGAGNKVTPSVLTDAYSAYFELSANRAHLTNNLR